MYCIVREQFIFARELYIVYNDKSTHKFMYWTAECIDAVAVYTRMCVYSKYIDTHIYIYTIDLKGV